MPEFFFFHRVIRNTAQHDKSCDADARTFRIESSTKNPIVSEVRMHDSTGPKQAFAIAAALTLMLAAPLRAQGPFVGDQPGGTITYEGGDVTLTLLFQDALYENQLFVFRSAIGNTFDPANAISVFSNKAAIGSTFTFNPAAELGLSAGDEIIFGICTNVPSGSPGGCGSFGSTNGIHYTGGADRNFDNAVHATVATSCGSVLCGSFTGTAVGFEDIREVDAPLPIDRDFNDIVFGVQQSPTTVVPEPLTMTLLATGLAGMSGAGLFRRRREQRRT
jgi:hypothetical protein